MDNDNGDTPLYSERQLKRVKDALDNLPVLKASSIPKNESCVICLTPFDVILARKVPKGDSESGVTKLVGCGHLFCRKDLSEWIRNSNGSCPICRHPFLDLRPHTESDAESSNGEYIPDDDDEEEDDNNFRVDDEGGGGGFWVDDEGGGDGGGFWVDEEEEEEEEEDNNNVRVDDEGGGGGGFWVDDEGGGGGFWVDDEEEEDNNNFRVDDDDDEEEDNNNFRVDEFEDNPEAEEIPVEVLLNAIWGYDLSEADESEEESEEESDSDEGSDDGSDDESDDSW